MNPSDKPRVEEQSIDALARAYAPALKRYFQRRVAVSADVDDLVQDVFLRLARRGDLQDVENVARYIFQIAANILRDRMRMDVTHRTGAHFSIQDNLIQNTFSSAEHVIEGKEAIERLKTALFELPASTRLIFLLNRVAGMPNTEVAKRLGVSLSTVNKRMASALEFLLERMKGEF